MHVKEQIREQIVPERNEEHIRRIAVPPIVAETVEVVQVLLYERLQQRTVEQMVSLLCQKLWMGLPNVCESAQLNKLCTHQFLINGKASSAIMILRLVTWQIKSKMTRKRDSRQVNFSSTKKSKMPPICT